MRLQTGTHLQRLASTWMKLYRDAQQVPEWLRQTSSVTLMIQNLGWEDLQSHHEQCKTIMMDRIINNLVNIPAEKNLDTFRHINQRLWDTIPGTILLDDCLQNVLSSHQQYISGTPCPPPQHWAQHFFGWWGQKNICMFQVSLPYLGFCPDPKHFIVNCEQSVKFAKKIGENVSKNAISI